MTFLIIPDRPGINNFVSVQSICNKVDPGLYDVFRRYMIE
jgi:hypothetical protein